MFDPEIESIYRPRPSLRALARQFWWYGRWKARVVRAHPGSLKARHLVPPLTVGAACAAPVVAAGIPSTRRALAAGAALYGVLVVTAVVAARPWEHDADPLTLAAAFPMMHGAWGAGFLASVAEDLADR